MLFIYSVVFFTIHVFIPVSVTELSVLGELSLHAMLVTFENLTFIYMEII